MLLCLLVLLIQTMAPVTSFAQKNPDLEQLPTPIQNSLDRLSRLYQATLFDSLKKPLDTLDALIGKDSARLSPGAFGEAKGQYHLYLGQYFGQRFELDSATYHFQKAMQYRARYNNYRGWLEPMAFSIEFLLTKSNLDQYLQKLQSGYQELQSKNPQEAQKQYGLYLQMRFFPTSDPDEKLSILHSIDSLISTGAHHTDGLNSLRFYTDVLEWCYGADKKELIAKFRPRYDEFVQTHQVSLWVKNYYEAVFAQQANRINEAIRYYSLVADDPNTSTNIRGASYFQLEHLHLVTQDTAKAYLRFKNLIQLRDSINAVNRYNEAAEMQKRLEEQQLKLQLTESQLENTKKTQLILILVGVSAVSGLFTLFFFERNQKKKNKLKLIDSELKIAKSEARNKEMLLVSKLALIEQIKNKDANGQHPETASPKTEDPRPDPIQLTPHDTVPDIDQRNKAGIKSLYNHDTEVEEVPNYIIEFLLRYPTVLTGREMKIIAFMNHGFDNNDLEKIFGVSPDAIRRAKWRLKKKLDLGSDVNLDDWARKIGRES